MTVSDTPSRLSEAQHGRAILKLGERASADAEVSVTTSGLLAIGILVSGILLSTAVLVRVAKR